METGQLAKETTAIDLACLLDAGEGAVVTLVAEDTRLVAHRALLVDRSPIFAAMFRHDMLEASSGEVTIADVEGPALRQLLAFFYTLQLQDSQLADMAPQLLVAADKYEVSVLKAACEQQLAAQLSVETAAAAVFLAVRHSCPSLGQAAIAYIKTHLVEVMATRGWADAVRLQPEDVDEVKQLLSETSDHSQAPVSATAASHLMTPQSLACESSTMDAIQDAKGTTAVYLGALMDGGDHAVVTLVAGDTRLVAHRAVLMDRSPEFATMFRNDTLESRSGQVTIEDVEGPVLRQLVSYLYTLRVPQLPGMASQLLAAAAKYGVESLKEACGQQVAAQLSVETAAAAAVLAVRHSCESLRQASIAFLMDHTRRVMASRGWADAMRSQPDDVIEVKKLLVAEMRRLPAEKKGSRFIEAAKEGAVGDMELLLAAGANVAASEMLGWTALHRAASRGHVEAARWLVARGAPVDARCSSQQTALHVAAEFGHVALARLLLASSADHSARDCHGYTPLHWTAYWGREETAVALLEAGADKEARSNSGKTPLDVARDYHRQQLIDLLMRP